MKYLDEAGLGYLLSKLRDIYARKGEAGGSAWHTGTALKGTQSGELPVEPPAISLVPGNFGDPGNSKTATVTLTAQRALTGVTVSGEFHVEEYYDDFSLIVNGEKIINEAHGERDWRQWWSGSLESGQTIQLIYTKDNSTSGKNEEQTRFSVTCDGFRADSFALATGSTPVESWTYSVSEGAVWAVGDYYLNTEELTLYRCTLASDASSSWDYICTLGGDDVDLSDYATKEELSDYATKEDLSNYATKDELSQAGAGNSINAAVVSLDSEEFENDGQPHAPKVRSVLLEGQPLTENLDYAPVVIPASAGGTYSALAVGIGQYTGAASKTWRVKKLMPQLGLSARMLTVKGVMGTTDSSVTITHDGSGRLSAESSNPQYATASVVGSTLRVTSVKPGSASILVHLDEDEQYDSADVELPVYVQRADGSISVAPQTIELHGQIGMTASATITKTGSGAVTVSSSAYVTSRISGNQLALTSVSSGSESLTLSLAETDDYTAASCELSVQVTIDASAPTTTLANNSWETILEVAAKGDASKYWKPGDVAPKVTFTLPIVNDHGYLDGESTTLTCDVRILGFDHDDLDETDEKYGDPSYNGGKNKAAISFEMVGTTDQKYCIHQSNSWFHQMNTIEEEVFKAVKLNEELAPSLRTVTKRAAAESQSSHMIEKPVSFFLLCIEEILGTTSGTSAGEGEQYAFYKNGGSKRKQDPSGAYTSWWTRSISDSAKTSSNFIFKAIQSLGFSGDTAGSSPTPISICFCI